MESGNQLQLLERDVKILSGTRWLSESMLSYNGGMNQFIYALDKGLNDLYLDFSISIFTHSDKHELMIEGKIYWNGELNSISYLSLGNTGLLSTGTITIAENKWYSDLKWIETNGQTKQIRDTSTFHAETFESHTEAKNEDGEFQFISKTTWQKI